MKKILFFLIILLTISSTLTAVYGQNLYQSASLKLQLQVNGSFELVPESSTGEVQKVTTELLLYPLESSRQKIVQLDTDGERDSNKITFTWNDQQVGKKTFSYTALLQTSQDQLKVQKKITFPFTDMNGYEQYTWPTKKIDSDHPLIIAKASELAAGEEDLFKVAFKLANWVAENVDYKLNDLTTNTAQPASWVLQNKQGVCDEMTSLFVAMCRSLGIPAKFVSGVSYTENKEVLQALGKNWAGHGWAEVYFPDIGWISFDIAFDEYGYIDPSHIKLREGFDPDEASTRYQWLADKVDLQAKELKLDVQVKEVGAFVPEEIQLQPDVLSPEIDFGSYNLIKVLIKNTVNNYAATTLQLSVPEEVQIFGKTKRTVLLNPAESKEISWVIKLKENLDANYIYDFPIFIFTEKNISVESKFSAKSGSSAYSREEMEKLLVVDEDKTYSPKVTLACDYPAQLQLQEEAEVTCAIKNNGNTNLQKLSFCVEKVCEQIDLPINQEKSSVIRINGNKAGWHNLVVSAENDLVDKRSSFTYRVMDQPAVEINLQAPAEIKYGDTIMVNISLQKKSFSTPKKLILQLQAMGAENTWEIEELPSSQDLAVQIDSSRIQKNNLFSATLTWQDSKNKTYNLEKELLVPGKSSNFSQSIRMFLNRILGWIQ